MNNTSIRTAACSLLLASALLFPSASKAQTWQNISANVLGAMTENQFANMASDGTRLYVLGEKGVFVSENNGNSFTPINSVTGGGPDLSQHVQRFIKFVNGEIWVGGLGFIASGQPAAPRLHRLTPGQTVWQASAGGLPGEFGEGSEDDLTYDPVSGIYFGTLSTGTVYVSTDGGNNWQPRTNGLGGIGSPSSIVPVGGSVLTSRPLAGVLKTTDQGLNWTGVRSFGQESIGNMIEQNGRLLLTAGRTLHFSDNEGSTWNQVPNLPHGASVLSSDGANVFAVSRDFTVPQALAYSASGGLTWEALTRDGLPPIPTFLQGYYAYKLLRHGDFLFLRGVTRNGSFALESTQLHRLDISAFNFNNDFQIVIQPQGKGLLVGQSYELEVFAAGQNLSYRWQKDGQDLVGETASTLFLENVQTTDTGDYTVLVKSGNGPEVPSAIATVTVFVREDGRWDPVFDQTNITTGGRVHLRPGNEHLVVRTDATSLAISRIGPDGGRLQNVSSMIGGNNDLSNSLIDQAGRIVVSLKPASNTNAIRRYNADTFALIDSLFFGPNTSSLRISDIMEIPGKGYAAVGGINTIGSITRSNFALVKYDNTVDEAFAPGTGPNGGTSSVTYATDGNTYVAGNGFNSWSGTATPRGLARIDSSGTVHALPTNVPGTNSANFIHALADGRLLTLFGSAGARVLYALNPDGSRDTTFNAANHTIPDIKRVAEQPDGKIIVVGNFTAFAGTPAAGYIRLNLDGTVDNTFFTATGFSNGHINDVTYDPRGYLYLSGTSNSTSFQGQAIPTGRGPVRIFATPAGNNQGGGGNGGFANWPALLTVPPDQRGPSDRPANDTVDNLIKYALGVPPLESAADRLPVEFLSGQGEDEGFPIVSYIRVKDLEGITIQVQISVDMDFLNDLGSTLVSIEDLGDGTERVTVRSNASFASQTSQFFRLRVTEN